MVKGFERDGPGRQIPLRALWQKRGSGGGGTTRGEGAGSDFAARGIGGGGVGTAGAPNTTPARVSTDFTMEINGSGGTNGFFQYAIRADALRFCSSRGSNGADSKITGMCERAGLS